MEAFRRRLERTFRINEEENKNEGEGGWKMDGATQATPKEEKNNPDGGHTNNYCTTLRKHHHDQSRIYLTLTT